jgi:hypothetical protein
LSWTGGRRRRRRRRRSEEEEEEGGEEEEEEEEAGGRRWGVLGSDEAHAARSSDDNADMLFWCSDTVPIFGFSGGLERPLTRCTAAGRRML